MRLEYIREFLALAETLNFSAAARQLYISQSTLSKHVTALEEELGVPLLERSTHYVRLTPPGQTACRALRDMMGKYDGLLDAMQSYGREIAGKLVLGLLYYSLDDYFSGLLPQLRQRYPAMQVELRTYQPHELYRELLDGRVHLAEMPAGAYPESERLRFHNISRTGLVAVLRADHPLAGRERLRLQELAGETLVELTEDFCSRIVTAALLERCGARFAGVRRTRDIETMAAAVRADGGVHITGENCRKQAAPGLCYVPLADAGCYAQNAFLYRADDPNPLIPLFLREADHYFQQGQKKAR